ncbi:MAG TPA: efflux RND transporter periplasmic adaptor subunit [Caulobacteraceae bacterium]|jgi:HlyD family secretion protein
MAGLTLAACGKRVEATQRPTGEQPLTVTVTPIAERSLSQGLTASGVLVAREEAGVASELSGYRIAQVMVDEGDYVEKGQPLARLDDTLLQAQIAQQAATVQQQEVVAERSASEAERVKGLDDKGVLSQEAIIERRLAAKSADAAVAVAKAGLSDLKTRETRMVIRAPVAGRVLERTARPGDTSAPGATLYRIARNSLVEMDAEVPEANLAQVKVGDPARVTLPSGEIVGGQVRFISPRVDTQTGIGHARIALPVRSDLRPGGFATVTFQANGSNAKVAPESAVHFDDNGGYVMVVGSDNRVHPVVIKTGRRSQGYVELTLGPPVGARVALGGGEFLLDGDKVTPVGQAITATNSKAAGQ